MRESNFAFPAQNRACVCITSQLYDRRALDTTSPLPLFNSLTHLNYLTSTSPRIREIMTMDGGLERLVRILHDFCLSPPPPENPTHIYGLSPPNYRPPKLQPTLNPQSFDKHAAYRFSLAFQSVVNIGVRGSEPIRSRVVQAGTLEVVGCVLEAWLANKGFAVGPSSSATGMPRETREQRHARRQVQAHAEQRHRQREEAAELARALQRQIQVDQIVRAERVSTAIGGYTQDGDIMQVSPAPGSETELVLITDSGPASPSPSNDTDTETSADNSVATTPLGSGTPTGTVVVPGRDRSGTIIGRAQWDDRTTTGRSRHRGQGNESSPSPDTSRPDTETEDDGDGDVEMDHTRVEGSPSPEPRNVHLMIHHPRRAIGIVSDETPAAEQVNTDAHIIINDADSVVGDGVGVEEGIISLEPNDDFAMGAPPGAPGAIDEGNTPRTMNMNVIRATDTIRAGRNPPDITPRAGTMNLPNTNPDAAHVRGIVTRENGGATPRGMQRSRTITANDAGNIPVTGTTTSHGRAVGNGGSHHHRDADSGPYRDEDVLLGLQLLAYLSKYPHVRQAFYKPRASFHPASAQLPGSRQQGVAGSSSNVASSSRDAAAAPAPVKEPHGFFRAFTSAARGKEKERERAVAPFPPASTPSPIPSTPRQTNVFSLVERFTFRPSSTETDLPNPPPKLPPEIQYWAGVIMRNACRKDESRGGIRQCANMLCGRWETFPREFAKCRRCRKAKYCGKECQSTAWAEGHRFWCSAKDGDEEVPGVDHIHHHHHPNIAGGEMNIEIIGGDDTQQVPVVFAEEATGTITARAERRAERDRERHRILAQGTTTAGRDPRSRGGIAPLVTMGVAPNAPPPQMAVVDPRFANLMRPSILRNFGRAAGTGTGTGGQLAGTSRANFDPLLGPSPSDQGGRRRAETVSGATMTTTGTGTGVSWSAEYIVGTLPAAAAAVVGVTGAAGGNATGGSPGSSRGRGRGEQDLSLDGWV